MQLNRLLLGKAMHNEQFIQWIFQRHHRVIAARKTLIAHLQSGAPEIFIDQEPLIGLIAQNRRSKVELESASVFTQPPYGAGIEKLASAGRAKTVSPLHSNINIGFGTSDPKRLKGWI